MKSLPAPLKMLQASLAGAREPQLRARLQVAIEGVRALYGLDNKPRHDERGDMKKRKVRHVQ